MNFWTSFEKTTAPKPKIEFIRNEDIVDLLDTKVAFKAGDWTHSRFIGPMFGLCSIAVPIITRDQKFFRKPDTNKLIAIPKQVLGFNYQTNELDEEVCPYLKNVTLDNELLLIATINYVRESTIHEKDYLLSVLQNDGLRKAYWNDKKARELMTTELKGHLRSVASRGSKDYFSNILVYGEEGISANTQKAYTDLTLRNNAESTKVDFLDYSSAYGLQVYLKTNKETPTVTPLKVIKFSESVLKDLFNDVVKLNTVTDKETRVKENKGVEDPEFGCEVLVRLEETQLKSFKGEKIYKLKFSKGDRMALNEAERAYLLWDTRKLKSTETYDQASTWLKDMGYLTTSASKVHTLDVTPQTHSYVNPAPTAQASVVYGTPNVASVEPTANAQAETAYTAPVATPVVANVAIASTIPAAAVDELPWETEEPVEVKVAPAKKPTKAASKAEEDFESLFQ